MTQNNHITLEANDYVGIKEEKNRPMRYEVENIQAIVLNFEYNSPQVL